MNDDDAELLADALNSIAAALSRLGTADAATPMGAIEHLVMEMEESSGKISDGLHAIADAIEGTTEQK